MNKKIMLSILLFLPYHIQSELSSHQEEFITRYAVDNELAKILDEHTQELKEKVEQCEAQKKKKHGVWTFTWLPNYYIKYNLDRISGMEKMRHSIEKYKLDYLIVPDKQIYHIKNQPEDITNANYLVIVKKIEADPNAEPLSADQTKQLCTIIEKTGYISMSRSNYIQTFNNKIALIDTESTFNFKRTLTGLIRLIEWNHNVLADYKEDGFKQILHIIIEHLSCKICKNHHTYDEVLTHLQNVTGPQAKDYISYFEEEWLKAIH